VLIVELYRPGGAAERVGVVGSCRVLTPMAKAVGDKRARLVWHGVKGNTHSAAEAFQHIAHCRDRLDIPRALAPYIFDDPGDIAFKARWIENVERCDTFLIEISSIEDFQFGEFVFNSLHLANNLVRGHGDGMLSWLRKLFYSQCDLETVSRAEQALALNGVVVTDTIREMLHSTRRISVDAASFAVSIKSIIFDPTKRWIFVPIFNVSDRTSRRFADRVMLRDMLIRESAANGCEFFDPTPIIDRAGRRVALDGDGASPIHYARDFEAVIGEALCRYMSEGSPGAGRKTRID
jgi:hypothetical protein